MKKRKLKNEGKYSRRRKEDNEVKKMNKRKAKK